MKAFSSHQSVTHRLILGRCISEAESLEVPKADMKEREGKGRAED